MVNTYRISMLLVKVMRITSILFCIQLFFLSMIQAHGSHAQAITIRAQQSNIQEVFKQIQSQANITFSYQASTLADAKPLSLTVQDKSLDEVLAILGKQTELSFRQIGTVVAVSKASLAPKPKPMPSKEIKEKLPIQQNVRGRVIDSTGITLSSATVWVLDAEGRRTSLQTKTNRNGEFLLQNVPENAMLEISYIGYTSRQVRAAANLGSIVLQATSAHLDEVELTYSTGYQYIPKERATGSFDHIDNNLINRSVSTDILSRLENLSPGLQFNHGNDALAESDPFVIRGRSTITANAQPLIVLDDFPYEGDLNNINPNDIESVTILKDAAAASIWGARAGNGVIVITTKKGRTPTPKIELNSNVSITGRPDLHNIKQISSSERIDIERWLFENGRYDGAINPATPAARSLAIPEVIELLIENPADLDAQLTALRNHSVLDDISKYLYRTSANQQHNLNVSGSQDRITYYMSGGFDRNLSNLAGEDYKRVSIRSGNTFKVNDRLNIDASLNFFHINDSRGNNSGHNADYSPYTRLADENGTAIPVYNFRRKAYVDTVGNGLLEDWTNRPIDEINNERHSTQRRDFLVNVGSSYAILEGLNAQVKYQFQNQLQKSESLFKEESFAIRHEINDYAVIDPVTGFVTYPFPRGGRIQINNAETTAHQGRGQLDFNRVLDDKHTLTALAGFEVRQVVTATNLNQNIGYNEETGSFLNNINTDIYYPRRSTGQSMRISLAESMGELRDNFLSYYANGAYTYDNRYTLSGSFRKDEANLFGVAANQKGTPLWSVGGAWDASKESFYNLDWLPYLKLRTSYGVNGNISRAANAQSTISLSNAGASHTQPRASVNSLPNRNLRWETVRQFNTGIDFATKNNRLSGTIEYYIKNATNLLAQSPVDPTYGVASMYLNVADMKGSGVDIQIRSVNIDKTLKWQTSLIYSHSSTEVTNYLMPVSTTGVPYLPILIANPLVGRPLWSVHALPWQGLDPETGDPIGLVNGEPSKDYNAIYNGTAPEGLLFFGTAQPTHFGAMMNTFSYKNIDLSFNISFKAGYYFRRPSISYSALTTGWMGHADYTQRWQNPGDEAITDVPSMVYPANVNRDNFYQYSEALVERGDHIRLEDINIGYRLIPNRPNRVFSSIRIFTYMSNLGMIWARNGQRIDPYYNNTPMVRPTFSFGTNVIF